MKIAPGLLRYLRAMAHADNAVSKRHADLVDRARKLAPLLEREARESELLRHPTDAAMTALCEAGIFELMVPESYGGLGLDLDTFLEVGLALAEGDASLSWVSTFYIEHNWMLCQFPEAFQKELFADRSFVLAPATIAPNGRAQREAGGFRLNGRWQWATGAHNGEWAIAGAILDGPPGPLPYFFALPMTEVRIEDTWHVAGMAATASNDMVIDDVLVPEARATSLPALVEGTGPGAALHDLPLYRTPMIPILGLAASLPAVGQARAVVRRFREALPERLVYGGPARHSERSTFQVRLARAELETQQAELLLRATVREIQEKRSDASLEDRARWLASFAWLVHQAKDTVARVAEASGASARFLDHPLQRAQRDLDTLSCHIVFDLDRALETHGRLRLGLPIGPGLL